MWSNLIYTYGKLWIVTQNQILSFSPDHSWQSTGTFPCLPSWQSWSWERGHCVPSPLHFSSSRCSLRGCLCSCTWSLPDDRSQRPAVWVLLRQTMGLEWHCKIWLFTFSKITLHLKFERGDYVNVFWLN